MKRVALLFLPFALASCATYTPQPLTDAPGVLAPPVAAALARDGAAIERPYLTPATIDLGQPLDANAIATLAVINNPGLKAQRLRAGVSDAQAFAARLLPDPTFSIGANKVLSGPDPLIDIASALGFDLAALRTRGVRLAQAKAAARQVRLDLAWAEWQTAGQARIQAVRIAGLERSLTLAAASRDAAQSLLDRTLRAGYDSQEVAVHKAILDQFPTLALTINANRDSAGNALLGPAVDFTLPLWNRNRGGIAVERATRDALKAEYDARLFQTRAEIAAAVGGIVVARNQRAGVLRDLPALQRFAAASRRAASRGDLAPATAETAEQALRDKQALLAQSEQDIAEQTIALELLTGTPKEDWPR